MDRITGQNFVLVDGLRMWQDRNLQANQEGTFGNAQWFNGVQEELMAIIAAGGETPNAEENNQVITAIMSLIAAAISGGAPGVTTSFYINDAGAFYVWFSGFGLSAIIQGFPVSLSVSENELAVLLPLTFPTGMLGGVVTDGGVAAYGYGMARGSSGGTPQNSCTIYLPIPQIGLDGSIGPRAGGGAGFAFVWGN